MYWSVNNYGKDKCNANFRSKKINYNSYYYGDTDAVSGIEVAKVLKQDDNQVFKTLVTVSVSKKYYVFMVPVACELNLKKAAKSVGEKSISMIPLKDLLPLTGYVHGGCSPIGMKKNFPVIIHQSAKNFSSIIFSAGKIGYQVDVSVSDLASLLSCQFSDIVEGGEI